MATITNVTGKKIRICTNQETKGFVEVSIVTDASDCIYDGTTSVKDTILDIKTNGVDNAKNAENANALDNKHLSDIYFVGCELHSHVETNPFYLLGFGSWTLITDRFIIGAGQTYTVGATGGESTHTLTLQEIPPHFHHANNGGDFLSLNGNSSVTTDGFASGTMWNGIKKNTQSTDRIGGGQAHNNMPPYIAEYIWRRDA